jgi:hypothetical protein
MMVQNSRRYDAASTGEPDELKGSRPVRWGAVGKVPDITAMPGNSPAAYPVSLPAWAPVLCAKKRTNTEFQRGTQERSVLSGYKDRLYELG